MMNIIAMIPQRFINENLAEHWRVDETVDSFERLIYHLDVRSNMKPYFEEALVNLNIDGDSFKNNIKVADLGAGVCWTSGIIAKNPKVEEVYAVDASDNRLHYAISVIKHFGVKDKVKIIKGTFEKPNVQEKVDIIVLNGALHHCYDAQIPILFLNIKQMLNSDGVVLISDEHYVNWVWSLKRLASYLKHYRKREELFYYPFNLRMPHPFSGEHWRTRKELENIFKTNGFTARFFLHNGDMGKDKPTFYHRLGWQYYHAILRIRNK